MSIFLPFRQADMKFRYGLCSLQIFNAILLHFSRRLRNFNVATTTPEFQ